MIAIFTKIYLSLLVRYQTLNHNYCVYNPPHLIDSEVIHTDHEVILSMAPITSISICVSFFIMHDFALGICKRVMRHRMCTSLHI